MLAALVSAVLLAGGYADGTLLFRFQDSRITESSGLVAGSRSDLLFTHNDSGDVARFFAVDRTGRTRATYRLRGVQARDWEDIARGPGGTLWLGDIGDNSASRDRGLLVGNGITDQRELIAAEPGQRIALACAAVDPLGEGLEELVADRMT